MAAVMGAVEIRSGDGIVLIGPPGLFPSAVRAHRRRYAAMPALFGHPGAVTRLRGKWRDLGLAGDPHHAADSELRGLFEQALAHNRLVALHIAPAAHGALPVVPVVPVATPPAPKPPPNLTMPGIPAPAPIPVSRWGMAEKIEAALRGSADHVGPELRLLLDRLLSVQTVATMVAFCVAIALAQAGGVSAAAIDAALLAIAYACAGLAGIQAVYEFIAATVAAATADTQADIDAASRRYAHAFIKLGEAFLAWLLARMQARRGGAARQEQGSGGSGGNSQPPPVERPANAMVGRRSPGLENAKRELKFPEGVTRNARGYVNGREYSGHAFDRMQERGLVPSAVEDAIRNGVRTPSPQGGGASIYYTAENGVTAIVDDASGRVITAY